jgi:D-xylulose reductase
MPWLTESESDTIVSMASNNLALRAGRTAAPNMTRSFTVDEHEIVLFEPSWTGDSIGHKTWGASLLLARRFSGLHTVSNSSNLLPSSKSKCLGLGEGTGLLGIAAVKVMSWMVTLTDLPSIIPNLQRNVEFNCSERVDVLALDWMNPPPNEEIPFDSFDVVIGSDLFYDPHHPGLVVEMIQRYLKKDTEARMVIGFPLRASHTAEVADFDQRMAEHFTIEHSGEDTGMDDWDTEIQCKWIIYRWKDKHILNNTL